MTPEHLAPDKHKMSVSHATQVFSRSVGNGILRCCENNQMDKSAEDTAYVVLFFNDLFDSLNGGGVPQYETLKGSIDYNSVHFAYWNYALSVLEDMDFVDKSTKEINNRSTVLRKLESTVRGYIELTRVCMNNGIDEVALRYFSNKFYLSQYFASLRYKNLHLHQQLRFNFHIFI